jgi:hypothetical protein
MERVYMYMKRLIYRSPPPGSMTAATHQRWQLYKPRCKVEDTRSFTSGKQAICGGFVRPFCRGRPVTTRDIRSTTWQARGAQGTAPFVAVRITTRDKRSSTWRAQNAAALGFEGSTTTPHRPPFYFIFSFQNKSCIRSFIIYRSSKQILETKVDQFVDSSYTYTWSSLLPGQKPVVYSN